MSEDTRHPERTAEALSRDIAHKEYRSRNRRTQACAAIPEAWRELVESRTERSDIQRRRRAESTKQLQSDELPSTCTATGASIVLR